ncbi:dihydrodipicolinate synthase family protein [Rhizobium oryzicola]|uniref:Dihydrodipicolinate synthase family protein n=1 Tax=Rhizobium oryzicola TaxID=1232668 RepID=A0ABT8STH5_9HYPH|nr:dihydrodipicolinate synthase family protein [Rhizobium oryzicola]MDO1581712.1 dihydrodipicolinate synthase family protein [Rhizobium oryzicola]
MFHGLSAFPPTPTDAQGVVDTAALARVLEVIVAAGADSIGLLGSTGGYAYLSRDQKRRAMDVAVECADGKVPIIVGIGALRTDESEALAREAEQACASGLLLAPVSYTPLTEEEVFQHFKTVAATTGLPLCIYNNPTTTKFVFSEQLIARLAALPNIAAVKMPAAADGDYAGEIARLRAHSPSGFAIGYSGDWIAPVALLAGADAWYSVVAGLLPAPSLALIRAAQAGDVAETRRIEESFQPLWSLFKQHGSFRVMYLIASLLGRFEAEPPRPILPLENEVREQVQAALTHLEK